MNRNEAETRAELIDPILKAAGWGVVEGSKILREHHITDGRIQVGQARKKAEIADYILVYKNHKIAVIEAKQENLSASEGVAQAKTYAEKLKIDYTYSCNGREIYEISMKSAFEGAVERFPSPQELWNKTFLEQNQNYKEWQNKFAEIPFENLGGSKGVRYYQEIAVNKTLDAVALGKQRILLTLATGTGKTFIAFQIAWKLFHSRWNLRHDGSRSPRILFLADRNILANQAFNGFSAFKEDSLIRIKPEEIRKKGSVPTNGSIFFTIFQTFMSGRDKDGKPAPYFGEYPQDFFDFIIIDECHRGGANDESSWRDILEYFAPAVQLGLTATPKRKDNVDTYQYFGEPIYIYSLKEGINDGFLTPFKVKRVKTTLDDYVYTSDDDVIEGEVEEGRRYEEPNFNKIIEIRDREAKRVKIFLEQINQNEKTIVFCANQPHAALVRDLVNQFKKNPDPNYCVRVTAYDGKIGEQYLREFQNNDKTIPTILTTSQKLSTGVDARNVRNIVLMRPVNSMIEFKQIIGRGTRLFDGKEYFTIIDFVDSYKLFSDPEWDGEPISEAMIDENSKQEPKEKIAKERIEKDKDFEPKKKLKIKLRDGKEREIQYMIQTSFWGADGKPISAEEFLHNMFGILPEFFKNEDELRKIWSNPTTRKIFLQKISEAGFDENQLENLQKIVGAENSDLFDVLAYISFSKPIISRLDRVSRRKKMIFDSIDEKQREFLEFVLERYIDEGFKELAEEKLSTLLELKYQSIYDATKNLGKTNDIRLTFFDFQKSLYMNLHENQAESFFN